MKKDYKKLDVYYEKNQEYFNEYIDCMFDRPTIKEHQAIHQKLIELGWIE